jgi:DNA-binding GntR family transcriptional regulator
MPLREHQLVELLDVSRNTIREAFRLLSRERLVVHHLHRGVAVRQLDEDDIHDIFRTRRPIELMAIEYSATAPRRSLLELLALVEQAEEAADRDDWEHVATMDIVFHQRLVELIGSERISAFFRIVHTELRLVFGIVERPPDLFARFVPRNRRLAELLLAGERATATSELEAYLDEGERLLTRGVRVLFSGSDAVDS